MIRTVRISGLSGRGSRQRIPDANFQFTGIDTGLENVIKRVARAFTTLYPSVLDPGMTFISLPLHPARLIAVVPYPNELGFAFAVNSRRSFQRMIESLDDDGVLSYGEFVFGEMFEIRYAALLLAGGGEALLAQIPLALGVDDIETVAAALGPGANELSADVMTLRLRIEEEFRGLDRSRIDGLFESGGVFNLIRLALRNHYLTGNSGPLRPVLRMLGAHSRPGPVDP